VRDVQNNTREERPSVTLEQRVRLYETILSNTPDLVYVFGLDHKFTFANVVVVDDEADARDLTTRE